MRNPHLLALYLLSLAVGYALMLSYEIGRDWWRSVILAVVLIGLLVVRDDLTKAGAP